jgi:hypothetical protein
LHFFCWLIYFIIEVLQPLLTSSQIPCYYSHYCNNSWCYNLCILWATLYSKFIEAELLGQRACVSLNFNSIINIFFCCLFITINLDTNLNEYFHIILQTDCTNLCFQQIISEFVFLLVLSNTELIKPVKSLASG